MSLLAIHCHGASTRARLEAALAPDHALVAAWSWERFLYLIRERPVTSGLVDIEALASTRDARSRLAGLKRDFPNLHLVLLTRSRFDASLLFQLGRMGIRNLVVLEADGGDVDLVREVARTRADGAVALVTGALAPYLPRREHRALNVAMECVYLRWSAEEFAERIGLSRPFLSERLKACGLPSAGHLLLWSRLLQAGHWLEDPGRTAESVSRQLEYSSGAAFRRALKAYTGATPTEVIEGGGLQFVLEHFMSACSLSRPTAVA